MRPRYAFALTRLRRIGFKAVAQAMLLMLVGVVLGSIIGGAFFWFSLVISPTGVWPYHLRAFLIPVPALLGGYIFFFWALARASARPSM